jgi:hypothetical protein
VPARKSSFVDVQRPRRQRFFHDLTPMPSMPATEINDLDSSDVCFFHRVPAGTFARPRPKTDLLADVCHQLPLQSLIKLLAFTAL